MLLCWDTPPFIPIFQEPSLLVHFRFLGNPLLPEGWALFCGAMSFEALILCQTNGNPEIAG